MANRSSVLGSDYASLDQFVLGECEDLIGLLKADPNIIFLAPCDDEPGAAEILEVINGRNLTPTSGGDEFAFTQEEGIDGFSIKTPIADPAPSPPPFVKDTTPHIQFEYNGSDIAPGAAMSIEIWFRFQELGDQQRTDGAEVTPDNPYEVCVLGQGGDYVVIEVQDGIYRGNSGSYSLPVIQARWTDTGSVERFMVLALADPNYWDNNPIAELNRWFYVVVAWDATTGLTGYCNGVKIATTTNRPPSMTGADFKFGGCGAQYDMVALYSRKLTKDDVAAHMAGAGAELTTGDFRLTNFFLNAVATYDPLNRITKGSLEVLRTGGRASRVTKAVIEVLRTVAVPQVVTSEDTIVFADGSALVTPLFSEDTITFGSTTGTVFKVDSEDTITFSERAYTQNIRVESSDTLLFTNTGNNLVGDVTAAVHSSDTINFSGVHSGHNTLIQVTSIDLLRFSGGDPSVETGDTAMASLDTLRVTDASFAFNPEPTASDSLSFSEVARGRFILPNPEIGLSVVLRSNISFEFPFTYVQTPDGTVLIANGVDPIFRWTPSDKTLDTAGVKPATVRGTLAATPFVGDDPDEPNPAYRFYVRFVDRYGNPSDLSPVSNESLGGPPFNYTGVPVPTESKVVRRQIFRNPAGSFNVYYLAIDTTDLTSTSFTESLTDDELLARELLAINAQDGSLIANVYGVPPAHKSCLAYHQGRVFFAVDVDYRVGNAIVTQGSPTVQGVGTRWTEVMAGRAFWVVGANDFYTIDSVDFDAQTLVLTAAWQEPTNQYAQYTIRAQPEERRLLYWSEAGIPEGVPPSYAVQIPEDGDELTGLVTFNSFIYIIESRQSYKLTFRNDPIVDGQIYAASARGCVNQRCIVVAGDDCYMLDELGVHKFNGDASEPVSMQIQDIFQDNPDGISINWNADTRLWHAAWDSVREQIRWFVSLGSEGEPKNALCYQYNLQRWSIEKYDRPITSSVDGFIPSSRSLVGSRGRSVLCLGAGNLDGVQESPGTRGAVSANPSALKLSATVPRTFADDVLDNPVSIASGRGVGQTRTVVAIVGSDVELDRPFMVQPDADSVYQFGGFAWEWKSGWFRFGESENQQRRDIQIEHKPTKGDASFNLSLYYNHGESARIWARDMDDDNIRFRSGYPGAIVQMNGFGGFVLVRQEGHMEIYTKGDRIISIGLSGVSCGEPMRFYSATINGVDQ